MIVKSLSEIIGSTDAVVTQNWSSARLLVKSDGMGFSLHDTTIRGGTVTTMGYKNHLEAVYCVEGEGEIETLDDGNTYAIRPGTLYASNQHDRHTLRSKTDMRLICVFNPPCTGREVHDEEGSYPLLD